MKVSAANQWLQSNYWIVVSKSKSFYWKWDPLMACQCSYAPPTHGHVFIHDLYHSALYRKTPYHICAFVFFFLYLHNVLNLSLSWLESGGREAKSKADLSLNHSLHMKCVSLSFPVSMQGWGARGTQPLIRQWPTFLLFSSGRSACSGNRHLLAQFPRSALCSSDSWCVTVTLPL